MFRSAMLLSEDDAKKVAKMMENQISALTKDRDANAMEQLKVCLEFLCSISLRKTTECWPASLTSFYSLYFEILCDQKYEIFDTKLILKPQQPQMLLNPSQFAIPIPQDLQLLRTH